MRRFAHTFVLSFALTWLALAGLACTPASTSEPVVTTGDSTDHGGASEWTCGTYKGHTLYTGPKGGCYYYNSSGNKSYVDRSYCNC